MKYPTINIEQCKDIALKKLDGTNPSLDSHTQWVGNGPIISLTNVEEVAHALNIDLTDSASSEEREAREARYALRVYSALIQFEPEILDDPGFWRYLSLQYFWSFIRWRQPDAFNSGTYLKYLDGKSSPTSVLTRMFIRGVAVGGVSYDKFAYALKRSTNFWHSWVIRVNTGNSPPMVRAFVEMQKNELLNTEKLQEYGKMLNKSRSNFVFEIFDDEKSRQLIEDLLLLLWENENVSTK